MSFVEIQIAAPEMDLRQVVVYNNDGLVEDFYAEKLDVIYTAAGVAVKLGTSGKTVIVSGQMVTIQDPKAKSPEVRVRYGIQSGVI